MTDLNQPGPDHPIALESPASIAIVGAGPIGLEAALYGRFLGYKVTVFDRGETAANVADWQHVKMFTPFLMLHSDLGRRAIETQDSTASFPAPEDLITGQQWRDQYLLPLSKTDLLRGCIKENCEVQSIGRSRYRKQRAIKTPERLQDAFTVVWRQPDGSEAADEFDFVLDASGSYGNIGGIGPGGTWALGEQTIRCQKFENESLSQRFHLGVPSFADTALWEGKRILVLGDGFSAATTINGLTQIDTKQVIWLSDRTIGEEGPLVPIESDPLPSRANLCHKVNVLGRKSLRTQVDPSADGFQLISNSNVTEIHWDQETQQFNVTVRTWTPVDWDAVEEGFEEPDDVDTTFTVDHVVINVGYQPDTSISRELQVHQCYATEGPMALAAQLLDGPADCMKATVDDCQSVLTTEGRFFVIGIKSYGRLSHFLYQAGLAQVRDVFRWIVGRADLDLYR